MRIKTNYTKKDVLFKEDYPTDPSEKAIYKYCCPICLRYFNKILVSSCCANYICRMCIGEMAKKAKKDSGFVIRCSYCIIDDFRLEDVKEEDTVKHYTDSPFKLVKRESLQNNGNE